MSTSRGRTPNHADKTSLTSGAVDAALKEELFSLYTNDLALGKIHFSFEDGPLQLQELLQMIITSNVKLFWPIDKEELATVWPRPFILPLGTDAADVNTHIPQCQSLPACPERVLNPALINLQSQNIPIEMPHFPNPNARVTMVVQHPTHEVHISTFWHDWVRGTENYTKRVVIPFPCVVSTLLLSKHTVDIAG